MAEDHDGRSTVQGRGARSYVSLPTGPNVVRSAISATGRKRTLGARNVDVLLASTSRASRRNTSTATRMSLPSPSTQSQLSLTSNDMPCSEIVVVSTQARGYRLRIEFAASLQPIDDILASNLSANASAACLAHEASFANAPNVRNGSKGDVSLLGEQSPHRSLNQRSDGERETSAQFLRHGMLRVIFTTS